MSQEQGDQESNYYWEETSQQPDGSMVESNLFKRSCDERSVLRKQTLADGRSRLVCIWDSPYQGEGDSIAGKVAVSEWFDPKSPSLASAIFTATAGIAAIGLGPHLHTQIPQENLPSYAEGEENMTDHWDILLNPAFQDKPPQRSTYQRRSTMESNPNIEGGNATRRLELSVPLILAAGM